VPTDGSPVIAAYRKFYQLNFEGARHDMGYLDVAGEKICVQHFSPHLRHGGTAFVLHGYLDHSGLQHRTIGRLLHHGMDVVAFDQPGHGLSTGVRASIESFGHYVDCLAACKMHYNHLDGPYTVVGHSMGGAISMTYLLTRPDVFGKAILVAPLFRPRAWRLIRSLHAVGRHFVEHQRRRFVANTRDEEFYRFIREVDPLSPRQVPMRWVTSMFDWTKYFGGLGKSDARVLVVQGTDDGTVDWRGNIEVIRKKFSNVRIHLVHEGRHHLLNEIDEISEKAWEVIEPFLKEH
jgi:alpha-beta hydrolase superfamily lysophospholipase